MTLVTMVTMITGPLPTPHISPHNTSVLIGHTLTLGCHVMEGADPAEYVFKWEKVDEEGNQSWLQTSESSYTKDVETVMDAGRYRCSVTNTAEQTQSSEWSYVQVIGRLDIIK